MFHVVPKRTTVVLDWLEPEKVVWFEADIPNDIQVAQRTEVLEVEAILFQLETQTGIRFLVEPDHGVL